MKIRGIAAYSYWLALFFLTLPFFSFAVRRDFLNPDNLNLPSIWQSLQVSLVSSAVASLIVLVIGIPAAYYVAKARFKFKRFFDALLNLPQVLPPAVIGILLLFAYGNQGFFGRYLNRIGIRTSFSPLAVILTFLFVSLPIFINGCALAFAKIDPELEQTAALLGDSSGKVFFRITLPLAKKGMFTAFLMSWSRGIAEFGATMMFAGNLPGVTQTLPLAIFSALETNFYDALMLAFIMFILAAVVLIGIYLLSKE